MDFMDYDSDSDYAFRMQMEEAVAASLSSLSRTPPSPPIVATSGAIWVVKNDRTESSTAKTDSADVRPRNRGYGFDFKKALGEGSSKGKGKIHGETVTSVRTDERNPNIGVGNFRNTSGNDNVRPSPVIQPQGTVRPAQLVGEGSSRVNAAAGKFSGNVLYRLYFKGLVSEGNGKGKMTDVLAWFGVAICDQRDNLLFEMKGPLIDNGINRQGADIKALIRGLTEALKLGIKHIAICCDSYPIFQYVSKSKAEANSNTKRAAEGIKSRQVRRAVEHKKEPKEPKKKTTKEKEAKQEKKKPDETEPANKEAEFNVSLLNIQVGLIRKAWKHPSADSFVVKPIENIGPNHVFCFSSYAKGVRIVTSSKPT